MCTEVIFNGKRITRRGDLAVAMRCHIGDLAVGAAFEDACLCGVHLEEAFDVIGFAVWFEDDLGANVAMPMKGRAAARRRREWANRPEIGE